MARSNLLPNTVSFGGFISDVQDMGPTPGSGIKAYASLTNPYPVRNGKERPATIVPVVAFGRNADALLAAEDGDMVLVTGRMTINSGALRIAADTIHNVDEEA